MNNERRIRLTRLLSFRGVSMRPTLEDGDEVWIGAVDPEDVAPGDLLAFARFEGREPGLVLHRVQATLAAHGPWTTRGDCRTSADEPVPAREMIGRAVAIRRDARLLILGSPKGAVWNQFGRAFGRWLAWLGAGSGAPNRRGKVSASAVSSLGRRLFRLLS